MFQIFVYDMRPVLHICDGDLEERTVYLCDIVHNLGCVVHHIYDVIYKIRVIVLNEAGVLTGDDNVEVCLFFDLVDDAKCEIIFYDTPENYLAVVDTDRAVLSYVGDLIFNGIKHTAFVVVLASACRDKADPFLCQFMYKLYGAGSKFLRSVLEQRAVQVACDQFNHWKTSVKFSV